MPVLTEDSLDSDGVTFPPPKMTDCSWKGFVW